MGWADTVATQALIGEVPALTGHVFVATAKGTDGAPIVGPYAVLWPIDGADDTDRLAGPPVVTHPAFTLHIVGASANQVQVIAGLVKAKFTSPSGFITAPDVTGRSNTGAYWRSPIPLQTDTDVTPALVYQVIELGWDSSPA